MCVKLTQLPNLQHLNHNKWWFLLDKMSNTLQAWRLMSALRFPAYIPVQGLPFLTISTNQMQFKLKITNWFLPFSIRTQISTSTSSTISPWNFLQANELFSNGMILTIQIKKNFPSPKQTHKPQQPVLHAPCQKLITSPNSNLKKKRLKEFLLSSFNTNKEEKPPTSKSFWQYRRNSSLNFDIGKRLIQLLQFLSGSNSTGSAPNPKQS